jgi:REP element-mobilizing transposase RayT
MVNYRRNKPFSDDSVFFLTIICQDRHPYLFDDSPKDMVLTVMDRIKDRFKCDFPAWVLLPDRLHWLMKPVDSDYSKVVLAFKRAMNLEI